MSSRLLGEITSGHVIDNRVPYVNSTSALPYRHGWRLQVWYPTRDGILICALIFFCNLLCSANSWTVAEFRVAAHAYLHSRLFAYSLAYCSFLVLFLKRHSYYIPLPVRSTFDEGILVLKAVALSMMLLLSALYLAGNRNGGSWWLSSVVVLNSCYLLGVRLMRSSDLERGIAAGWLVRNALIIGTGQVGQALAAHLERNPKLGYAVKGFLDEDGNDPRLLGRHADLYRVLQKHFIDEVFISTPINRDLVKRLTLEAPKYRVNVTVVPDLYDGIGWQTPVSRIGHIPVMILHREEPHSLQLVIKRIVDFVGAAFGLIVLSPFMLAIAAVIKWDTPGSVFYRSRRVGKKGMVFDCLKFRTMHVGADEAMEGIAHLNERKGGPLFKIANDPRVTPFGRFLRRYSLDELPQLLNVLKGEMSLVGPRPPIIQEYRQYQLGHLRKLEVMPGITGLWQICARQDPSFESYIKYDLEYIENWSLWMDLSILVRTVPAVLFGTGM